MYAEAMSRTAEEAMLVAAMEGDDEKLSRLAENMTSTEHRYLVNALNKVYDAIVSSREKLPVGD